jgi:short-subunit dehydrogenase
MKILLTGSSSGIGAELLRELAPGHEVHAPKRDGLDLCDAASIMSYVTQSYDMLINCAGTGLGGKIDFLQHDPAAAQTILKTNLLGTVLLTQQVLRQNPATKIVNITSTNNNRFYPGDLAYSLSKKALESFTDMLRTEYPSVPILEVRLGLSKTNFNQNRYRDEPARYQDIYQNPYLDADVVARSIIGVLFDNHIKRIEISP